MNVTFKTSMSKYHAHRMAKGGFPASETREPLVPAVREEPTMSTVHRILLTAFARPGRTVAGRRAGDTGATTRQSMGHDVLTCTPWAGLYVEGPDAP